MGIEVNFNGKIAFVTGASSGLGSRFAKILAEAGAQVAVHQEPQAVAACAEVLGQGCDEAYAEPSARCAVWTPAGVGGRANAG